MASDLITTDLVALDADFGDSVDSVITNLATLAMTPAEPPTSPVWHSPPLTARPRPVPASLAESPFHTAAPRP